MTVCKAKKHAMSMQKATVQITHALPAQAIFSQKQSPHQAAITPEPVYPGNSFASFAALRESFLNSQ
jgi:hypothetical protein